MTKTQDKREAPVNRTHGNRVPLAERFWTKVDRRGSDECWPWTGCHTDKGYGRIAVNRVSTGAHVVCFYLTHGRWPSPGMEVHHTCHTRNCQNPAHHEETTGDENKRLRKRKPYTRDEYNAIRRQRRAAAKARGGYR